MENGKVLKFPFVMESNEHFAVLEDDYSQAVNPLKRLTILLKLTFYLFARPISDFLIRKRLIKYGVPEFLFDYIDLFLRNEGGMFKQYAYGLCDKLSPLRNSAVLVPGIGYGRNLFQLARWRPKIIVAFDLYKYQNEWAFLKKEIKEKFGVEVLFLKGGFEALDKNLANSFDFIITDAVLEHISDLPSFAANAKKFLKNGGVFYASFGPLWYGPEGDHVSWGKENLFDHLLLSEESYGKQFQEKFEESKIITDSCESAFMIKERLFSFLAVDEYIQILEEAGFRKAIAYAKIPSKVLKLKKEKPDLFRLLDKRGLPVFDRFASGLYLWLRLSE